MSTSATQTGTTTRAGRSGKGLGIAAAALAVVIAAGFVFAVNQGNQPSSTAASERAAQIAADRYDEMVRLNELAASVKFGTHADANAEINRLNALAEQVKAESHPAFNIEKTKMELAGQLTEHPGTNIEKTKMDMRIDKLDEQIPTLVPVAPELVQPEWDNRLP